jgi:hypothetical protein
MAPEMPPEHAPEPASPEAPAAAGAEETGDGDAGDAGGAPRASDADPPGSAPEAGDAAVPEATAVDAGAADAGAGDAAIGIPADPDAPPRCADGAEAEPVRGTLVGVAVQPVVYARGGTAGLVMPLPSRADVRAVPSRLLEDAARLARPTVVERTTYVEDPSLGYQCDDPHYSTADAAGVLPGAVARGALAAAAALPFALAGCGADDGGAYDRPRTDRRGTERWVADGGGVVDFERIATTEEYDVTVLSASSLDALHGWLEDNGLAATASDEAAFAHYVAEQAWFLAIKVRPPDVAGAKRALRPLVATFRAEAVPLMNRLQFQRGGGTVFTDAFVVAPWRAWTTDGTGSLLHATPERLDGTSLAGFGPAAGWVTHVSIPRRTCERREDATIDRDPVQRPLRERVTRDRAVRNAMACCTGRRTPDPAAARTIPGPTRAYVEGEYVDDGVFPRTPEFSDPASCRYSPYPAYDGAADYTCSVVSSAAGGVGPLGLAALQVALRRRRVRSRRDAGPPDACASSPWNDRLEWMTDRDGSERKAADRAIQAVWRGRRAQRAAPSRPSGAA